MFREEHSIRLTDCPRTFAVMSFLFPLRLLWDELQSILFLLVFDYWTHGSGPESEVSHA